MSAAREVICDGCGADITYTGNSVDYRLVLASQSKTPWYAGEGLEAGVVTDMWIENPLPEAKHFCSLRCLASWLETALPATPPRSSSES